jgi:hypothetical protein
MGRRAGSPNKGYFYRDGRGWYSMVRKRMIPLRAEDESHLRDKSTPAATLKAAHRRIIAEHAQPSTSEPAERESKSESKESVYTAADVCGAYLAKAEADESQTTYNMRADTLFDFITGYPARFRVKKKGDEPKAKTATDRIHKGYGQLLISEFLPLHVDQWLAAHKGAQQPGSRDWRAVASTRANTPSGRARLRWHFARVLDTCGCYGLAYGSRARARESVSSAHTRRRAGGLQ